MLNVRMKAREGQRHMTYPLLHLAHLLDLDLDLSLLLHLLQGIQISSTAVAADIILLEPAHDVLKARIYHTRRHRRRFGRSCSAVQLLECLTFGPLDD